MTGPAPSEDDFTLIPLSFGQDAIWFFQRVMPKSTVYHVPLVYRITGELDAGRLDQALAAVVARHEILRTALLDSGGITRQVVMAPVGSYLTIDDLTNGSHRDKREMAEAILREQISLPLDLVMGEVFRARLIRFDSKDQLILIALHHIVTDSWSNRLLIAELSEAYRALMTGGTVREALPKLPVQYADYALWQREWLRGPVLEERLRYWSDKLDGLLPLELEGLAPRPRRPTFAADLFITELDQAIHARAVNAARKARVSLFAELAAAFSVTLAALTGRADISFGTMFAGRPEPDLELLIGYFVNAVVLRSDLSGDPTFRDVMQQLNRSILDAIDHEAPFGSVVERVAPRRTPARNPLFQVSVQLLTGGAAPNAPRLPGASCQAVDVYQGQHPLDLTITFIESGEHLTMQIQYSLELFDEAFVQSFAARLICILDLGTAASDSHVRTLIGSSHAT